MSSNRASSAPTEKKRGKGRKDRKEKKEKRSWLVCASKASKGWNGGKKAAGPSPLRRWHGRKPCRKQEENRDAIQREKKKGRKRSETPSSSPIFVPTASTERRRRSRYVPGSPRTEKKSEREKKKGGKALPLLPVRKEKETQARLYELIWNREGERIEKKEKKKRERRATNGARKIDLREKEVGEAKGGLLDLGHESPKGKEKNAVWKKEGRRRGNLSTSLSLRRA